MTSRLMTATGVVLALVLLFAVNILANRILGPARIDLTENRLFTLSEGTHAILAKLDEPVTLRFYLSQRELERVPGIGGYADRVRALLNEYKRLSGGTLALHVIDPEPFSEEEDRAVGYGLRGVPLGLDEGIFYFGLAATNSVDDEEVIPFFAAEREQFLEYDVTKLVHNLTKPKQKTVGLLSSLPIEGQGPPMQAAMGGMGAQPWMVVEQIRQLFELRSLHPKLDEITADIDVLMLVHPQTLPREALYAIDQYVLRGGRVVAFVDPYSEVQQDGMAGGFMQPVVSRRSEIDDLLSAWGATLGDEVVADLDLALKVRMEQGGRVLTFDYPVWMNITPHTFDQDDIVTGNLGNLGFGTPGYLEPANGATTTFTPLVTTTSRAAQFTTAQVAAVTTDPRDLLDEYTQQDHAYTVVARISGKVGTAFPGGRPPSRSCPRRTAARRPTKKTVPGAKRNRRRSICRNRPTTPRSLSSRTPTCSRIGSGWWSRSSSAAELRCRAPRTVRSWSMPSTTSPGRAISSACAIAARLPGRLNGWWRSSSRPSAPFERRRRS